jgi:hypothetical protein
MTLSRTLFACHFWDAPERTLFSLNGINNSDFPFLIPDLLKMNGARMWTNNAYQAGVRWLLPSCSSRITCIPDNGLFKVKNKIITFSSTNDGSASRTMEKARQHDRTIVSVTRGVTTAEEFLPGQYRLFPKLHHLFPMTKNYTHHSNFNISQQLFLIKANSLSGG